MSLTKRTALATIVAGLTATLVALGGATAATAASPALIPAEGATATVTIHKHEQGSVLGAESDGLQKTVTSPPIGGVTFTAKSVQSVTVATGPDAGVHEFDLTTNVGWLNAAKLVRASDGTFAFNGVAAVPAFGSEITRVTSPTDPDDASVGGIALFENLPVGLYLFTETDAPAGVTKAQPWLMTAPMTDPIGDPDAGIAPSERWNYDLHVYPKNHVTDITKTVMDAGSKKVGDSVIWTITADVPLIANPDFDSQAAVSASNLKFFAPTQYVITDDLDERLAPGAVAVVLKNSGGVALEASDYAVAWSPADKSAGADLTVTFTEAGLAKLALAASSAPEGVAAQVEVELQTTVTSLPVAEGEPVDIGDGVIANSAGLLVNDATVKYSDPVRSLWGDLVIRKVDARDNSKVLANAEFQIFDSLASAKQGTDPITIGGVSSFPTGEDGLARITGLRYTHHANGAPTTDPDEVRYYWVVESKAPNGFELLAEPIRVEVTAAGEAALAVAYEIENVPSNAGFELPLTGGAGTVMFTMAGLLIIAAGVFLMLRKRKLAAH